MRYDKKTGLYSRIFFLEQFDKLQARFGRTFKERPDLSLLVSLILSTREEDLEIIQKLKRAQANIGAIDILARLGEKQYAGIPHQGNETVAEYSEFLRRLRTETPDSKMATVLYDLEKTSALYSAEIFMQVFQTELETGRIWKPETSEFGLWHPDYSETLK